MHEILRRRYKERQEAIQLAKDYVNRLEKDIRVCTAVLFGSFARGDFNLGSDIDVLIISDCLPREPLKRAEMLYRYVSGNIEPKGYTKTEFLKLIESNNPIALDAIKDGEIISDDGFWDTVRGGHQ